MIMLLFGLSSMKMSVKSDDVKDQDSFGKYFFNMVQSETCKSIKSSLEHHPFIHVYFSETSYKTYRTYISTIKI